MKAQQNNRLFHSIFGDDTDNITQEEHEIDGKKVIVTGRGATNIDCKDLKDDGIKGVNLMNLIDRTAFITRQGR